MKRWKNLSLRKRVLISVLIVLVLGAAIWTMVGYPAFTAEGYLRRAEKSHLLPEGEVLLRVETMANGPDFLIADGGQYLELCRLPKKSTLATYEKKFYLYEKQGDLTVVPLPSSFYGTVLKPGYKQCALLLFDERPEVQRVELDFAIGEETFTTQAEREVGGVFCCYYFHAEELFWDSIEGGTFDYQPDIHKCIARLYSYDGALIEETEVPVGTRVA